MAAETSTDVAQDETFDPTRVEAITHTAAVALTQGTPAAQITVEIEDPLLTATPEPLQAPDVPPDDSGIPTGLLVGGGLLLAAGLGGAVYFINRKTKQNDLE